MSAVPHRFLVIQTVLNTKLQELAEKVGELKGKINKHKKQIEKSIVENQDGINDFLKIGRAHV